MNEHSLALSEERRMRLLATLERRESVQYTLRRCHVDVFYATEVPRLAAGSRVLDLGGVRKEKMPGQFSVSQHDVQVVTVNIQESANPDIIASGEDLPLDDNSFDAVICSEVLEHVRDPRLVLDEIARVLRSGGRLLLTVPLHYHIHASPHDYARYTDFFWTEVLSERGFVIEKMEKQGLYWSVMLDFLFMPLERAAGTTRNTLLRKFLRAIQRWPLAWARRWAVRREAGETAHHPVYTRYTGGYGIVAHLQDPVR